MFNAVHANHIVRRTAIVISSDILALALLIDKDKITDRDML